jgi:hypothetical protein
MVYTDHAERRMQQRAIPSLAVELLQRFGRIEHSNGGARIRYFDKRARNRLIRRERIETAQVERLANLYLVENQEGVVITAGHRTRPIRRDFKPGARMGQRLS